MSKDKHILATDVQRVAKKRARGCYFTAGLANPFALRAFRDWAERANLKDASLLEPFAGRGDLLHKLASVGLLGNSSKAYDIAPAGRAVSRRDTLRDFPKGFDVCVTNPPWLARNSATMRGLPFPPDCVHDDLYKQALELCLLHCGYVAALIPESFIRSFTRFELFYQRCESFVSLTGDLFCDTAHPVGLAMFAPSTSKDVRLYRNDDYLGCYNSLRSYIPATDRQKRIRFNAPNGALGLFALDNTKGASIRFCSAHEVASYNIDVSSRAITIIDGDFSISRQFINKVNKELANFREKTHDIFLTAYRGLRSDGKYRRRLDWAQAKSIIEMA